jgi:GNAT superfamily N-acetyltransferase
MGVTVRAARPGDGTGISRAWLSVAAYYAELDPEHFQVPRAEGLAEGWDNRLGQHGDDALQLVAELDGQVFGWLAARIEHPEPNAETQLVREHGWSRLVVDALIVHHGQWGQGAGTVLLEAAEAWGKYPGCPGGAPGHLRPQPCLGALLRRSHGLSTALDRLSEAALIIGAGWA